MDQPLRYTLNLSIKEISISVIMQVIWHCTPLKEAIVNYSHQSTLLQQLKHKVYNYILGKEEVVCKQLSDIVWSNNLTNYYCSVLFCDILKTLFPFKENEELTCKFDKVEDIKDLYVSYEISSDRTSFTPMLYVKEDLLRQKLESISDISKIFDSKTLITDFIDINDKIEYCGKYFPKLLFISLYTQCEDLVLKYGLFTAIEFTMKPKDIFKGRCPKADDLFYNIKGILCDEKYYPTSYWRTEKGWIGYQYNRSFVIQSSILLIQHLLISGSTPSMLIYEKYNNY